MVVYHGTHTRNARRIQIEGFVPRAKRVWFTKDVNYARRRAKTKAGRSNGRPVVLTCKLNLPALRKELGSRRVVQQGHVVVISGHISASVIIRNPVQPIHQELANWINQELANWINTVLGVKPYKGVSPKHAGIARLAGWIQHRTEANPTGTINQKELLQLAQQWLPEYFRNVRIDFDELRAFPKPISPEAISDFTEPDPTPDTREEEALDLLLSDKPEQRIRGMTLLSKYHPPDLFDWCAMFLNDNDLEMRVLTLETMVQCDDV
ncbi:MAG: hypothetical protein O7G87_18985, partial [bacterium]|nr:hypothetical protein [bacterium]